MKIFCLCLIAACISGTSGFGKRQAATPPPPTSPPPNTDAPTPPPPTTTVDDVSVNATAPALVPDENCLDKREDCRRFGEAGCRGVYSSWAKTNCPRYCKFCIHPNDTKVECVDNIDNCDQYQSDMCTNPKYRLFAEDNCKVYCNLCNAGPKPVAGGSTDSSTNPGDNNNTPGGAATSAPSGNGTCMDTVDYCWNEPDENCFGIYEPWAKTHCPFRCGFCAEKPKCEDEVQYCSQYDLTLCTADTYTGWFRKNCRKACNLCALPTRPPAQASAPTDSSGNAVQVAPPTPSPQQPSKSNSTTMTPDNFGPAGSANPLGNKNTYVIQGPPPKISGTCLYKGETHPQDKNWFDGCDYICNCFDATHNRVICTDRCIKWGSLPTELNGCKIVREPGDCCERLECDM